jgi:hypothetical protein
VAADPSYKYRAEVAARASYRCEYCLIREQDTGFPHQLDHIISRKHGGLSTPENLALACIICNRYKGTDIGSLDLKSGELVRLFHPRRDRWKDHFQVVGVTIEPLTDVGRVTAALLRLNAPERLVERHLLQELRFYPRG